MRQAEEIIYSHAEAGAFYPFMETIDEIPPVLLPVFVVYGKIQVIRFNRNMKSFLPKFLEAVDLPYTEYRKVSISFPQDPISDWVLSGITSLRFWRTQQMAQLEGLRCLVAVRLYESEHGIYPNSLDALVPEYLNEIPMDPLHDKGFVYESLGNDFRLYGLGLNGIDDGGKSGDVRMSPDQIIHLPEQEINEQKEASDTILLEEVDFSPLFE